MYQESASIKIIQNTRESIKRSFDLVQSAREEVLRIFSSHNLHFKIGINPACYLDLVCLSYYDKNNGKHHSENIGTSRVDYVLYPNGIVDTHVRCSNNPFKLETEIDRNKIIAFFGQVRDRPIILLRDERERIVPNIMDWYMTECDVNKDIKIGHLLYFSAIKVQVKYLDHLFRIYIKSMGKETMSRVEESLHTKKPAIETINNIFNPMENVEKQIVALKIYDLCFSVANKVGSRIFYLCAAQTKAWI